MNTIKRYTAIAKAIGSMKRCEAAGNQEWYQKHGDAIEELTDDAPSGSGFDSGTQIDMDASTGDKLVFHTAFHHMNENGMYDGWTEHKVTITPSFELGFRMSISGPNRNDIKDMISDMFTSWLDDNVGEWEAYPKTDEQPASA